MGIGPSRRVLLGHVPGVLTLSVGGVTDDPHLEASGPEFVRGARPRFTHHVRDGDRRLDRAVGNEEGDGRTRVRSLRRVVHDRILGLIGVAVGDPPHLEPVVAKDVFRDLKRFSTNVGHRHSVPRVEQVLGHEEQPDQDDQQDPTEDDPCDQATAAVDLVGSRGWEDRGGARRP